MPGVWIIELLHVLCICFFTTTDTATTSCKDNSLLNATDTLQYFASHIDYDGTDYNNNELRCWEIVTSNSSHVIQLVTDSFHLEVGGKACSFDYVAVYDGSGEDSDSVLGRFCGEEAPDTQYSSNKAMYVKFQTDSSVTESGFKFGYQSIHESMVPNNEGHLSTGVILGIIFAALVFLIVVLVIAVVCIKKNKNKVHQSSRCNRGIHSRGRVSHINTVSGNNNHHYEPHMVQFSPPPSYEDAILHGSNQRGRQNTYPVPGQYPVPSSSLPRRSTLHNMHQSSGESPERGDRANNMTSSAYRRSMSYQLESVSYSTEMNPLSPPPPYSSSADS